MLADKSSKRLHGRSHSGFRQLDMLSEQQIDDRASRVVKEDMLKARTDFRSRCVILKWKDRQRGLDRMSTLMSASRIPAPLISLISHLTVVVSHILSLIACLEVG